MPNTKSAKKRMRSSERARIQNKDVRSEVRYAGRKMAETITAGDAAVTKREMNKYFSILDKAAKHGVITKNAVSRRKSSVARKIAQSKLTG
jgi:small subunit ribosomal protein S20